MTLNFADAWMVDKARGTNEGNGARRWLDFGNAHNAVNATVVSTLFRKRFADRNKLLRQNLKTKSGAKKPEAKALAKALSLDRLSGIVKEQQDRDARR